MDLPVSLPTVIEVTADDLRDGIPRNPTGCPVCLAVNRLLPDDSVLVSVGNDRITLREFGWNAARWTAKLPPLGLVVVEAVDTGLPVQPESFVLSRWAKYDASGALVCELQAVPEQLELGLGSKQQRKPKRLPARRKRA